MNSPTPARRISCGRAILPRSMTRPGPSTCTCAPTRGACTRSAGAARGCGRFFNALRDTTSDRFAATYRIGTQAMSTWRTAAGGLIDRSRPLSFSFDGRIYRGFAGDTLASALLANGVHLVGALVQVPPAARHPGRRRRGAQRAGGIQPRPAAHDAEPARHAGGTVRRAGRDAARTAGRVLEAISAQSTTCCRRFFRRGSTTRPSCGRHGVEVAV